MSALGGSALRGGAPDQRTLRAGVRVAWQTVPREAARREIADSLVARIAGALPGARPDASLGAPVTVGRRCQRCGAADHGRPVVVGAPVLASVSYAGDLVVVAVAEASRVLAVGVDVEQTERGRADSLRGLITPGRGTSLRHWTRVEAVLKADGRGLSVEPGRVRIERSLRGVHASITGDDTGGGARTATGGLGIRPRLLRVRGPKGVVISLAIASV